MPRKLVIIHGWSDKAHSFKKLGNMLLESGVASEVKDIHLGDYVSLVDAVTFDDLVEAMDRAWTDRDLPRRLHSVNAVVHSTGGLVVRDWLDQRCHGKPPIKNLLMLAPANFGSPLAHLGSSVLGRIMKGMKSERTFEVGATILKGLELASPYTWDLAMRDRFAPNPFDAGNVLCTVLVGNDGYGGLASLANKPGSDGTVRASTANMNCTFVRADFSKHQGKPTLEFQDSMGTTAFAVMDKENHSTICAKKGGFQNEATFEFILQALRVNDGGFADHCKRLEEHTGQVMPLDGDGDSEKDCYQSTDVFVDDDLGHSVADYVMEFYDKNTDRNFFTRLFNEEVVSKVHVHSDDPAYRNFLFNVTVLFKAVDKAREGLNVNLSAHPDIRENRFVGYRTFGKGDLDPLFFERDEVRAILLPHRTLMAHLTIHREVADKVFRFKGLEE